LFIYPLIVAVVSLVFGLVVLAQWARRRRPQQAVWSFALLVGAAVGSFIFVGFEGVGHELLFRLYYICVALFPAAYLGMGSLYLVVSRRVADLILAVLAIVSALGVALMLAAPLDHTALLAAQHAGTEGTGVLKPGLWLIPVILNNVFGSVALIGVALYSAYKVVRRQAPPRFVIANVVIAAGAFIVAGAGSSARLGNAAPFWIVTTAGYIVLFAGFLLTTNLAAMGVHGGRDVRVGSGATST
jgi:hypothetical protein